MQWNIPWDMWNISLTDPIQRNIVLLLVFIVPLFLYLIISRILNKIFKKTPDDPLFPEKEKGKNNILLTLLKIPLRLALMVVVIVAMIEIPARFLSNNEDKKVAKEQAIMAEYEASNDINLNKETRRRILTQAYLRKEYKLDCLYEEDANNLGRTLFKCLLVFVLFIAGGADCVISVYSFYRWKKKISFLSIFGTILLIPIIVIGFKIIDDCNQVGDRPNPETAKVSAIVVTVTGRREDVHHDEDNGDTSKYFIYVDYGDGKGPVTREVGQFTYDTADVTPDTYYMGRAEENGKIYDFHLYPRTEYELEKVDKQD